MLRAAVLGTLAAGAIVFVACSPFGGASVFHCETDSQCASGGTCKLPEGLCTIPNADCASGQEYGPHSGSMSGKCVGDEMPVDAAIDAPTMCTPNAKICFNHAVETCRATGDGFDPAMKEQCAITCTESATPACVGAASNIPLNDQQACNATGTALALSPAAGATVTINAGDITCTPMCNAGGTTTIPRTASTPNNFFCLAAINIPAGVTVNVAAGITNGVTLFSHGAAVINSDIKLDGGDATGVLDMNAANEVAGAAGPGGFAGGASNGDNMPGANGLGPGTCGGRAGLTGGAMADRAGSGGGGGGNQSAGGSGGEARQGTVGTVVLGGAGGTATGCSTADLRPLVGGAGGASGGDGACGLGRPCGWPGGGGGGALHIVSRSMISGSGVLSASGGAGFGEDTQPGGAGGGGAGGGLLIEAPTVAFAGALRVNGGNGGKSNAAAAGGAGASGGTATGGDGTDAANAGEGGAGGGGGGGRVRINANTGASCANASPGASCTTGALRTAP